MRLLDATAARPTAIMTSCALLFDMDGTLVDSTAVVERLWRDWCVRNGLELAEVLSIAHGRRDIDVIAQIAPHLDAANEAEQFHRREIAELDGVVEVPGARALLTVIPSHRWGVVTSASRDLALARMGAAGLPIPEILISADQVKVGKPSPEGYLAGAFALGVEAKDCIVFEDATAGIEAGLRAGSQVVAVTATASSVSVSHEPQIRNFTELTLTERPDGRIEITL